MRRVAGIAFLALLIAACGTANSDSKKAKKPETCSAAGYFTELPYEPVLPEAVTKTQLAVARAAVNCDYDALARLAASDFQYSFGAPPGREGAARFWREAEGRGEPVLKNLVDLLLGPLTEAGGVYTWPAPDAIQLRTGIDTSGNWLFYVAGD
jgi:hypothetical protein